MTLPCSTNNSIGLILIVALVLPSQLMQDGNGCITHHSTAAATPHCTRTTTMPTRKRQHPGYQTRKLVHWCPKMCSSARRACGKEGQRYEALRVSAQRGTRAGYLPQGMQRQPRQ
jgi:hypothetical protein